MASIRELLQFVVEMDARSAIRGFNDLESASTKSLGKAETGLQKFSAGATKFGAAALAGAGIAAVGLYKMATAAGELELSQKRLSGIFQENAGAVLEFTKNANQFGLSDKAAASAAVSIGEAAVGLGLSAKEAANLTPQLIEVTTQLGLLQGMDTAAALETVNAAMRGEYDSLQRLVPAISNATIVQKALLDTHKATASQLTQEEKTRAALELIIAHGTATLERSGGAMDSLAGKTAIAKANLQDAATTFGAAAVPATEGVTTAIGGLANAFNGLPDSVQGAIGAVATWGTIATAGIGAVSLALGQLNNLKKGFDALRNMEGVGATIGKFGPYALAAAAGATILGAAWYQMGAQGRETEARVKSLTDEVARSGDTLGEVHVRKLAEWISSQEDVQDVLEATDTSAAQFTKTMQGSAKGWDAYIDKLKDVLAQKEGFEDFNELINRGTVDQRDRISDLVTKLENQRAAFTGSKADIDAYNKTVEDLSGVAVDATAKSDALTGSQEDGAAAAKEAEAAEKALADATKEFAEAVEAAERPLSLWRQNIDAAAEGASEFSRTMEDAATLDDFIEGASEAGQALNDFKETFKDLPHEVDLSKLALGGYNEEQTKALDNLVAAGDANSKYLEGLIQQGQTTPEVTKAADDLRGAYEAQMRQAGYTEEQIQAYIDVLNLTPKDVETAIKLSGDEIARYKLSLYAADIAALPPDKKLEILAAIDRNDFVGAWNIANEAVSKPLRIPITYSFMGVPQVRPPGWGGQRTAAAGRAAAAGMAVTPYVPPAGQTAGTGSYSNITINMPAGADGTQIVNALRRYEKRNGNPNRGWRPT